MVSQLLQSLAAELERGPAWLSILLDASVKATVLLVAAGVTHRLLRRSPASARHAVWVAAVSCALVLPVLSAVLPTWRLEILPIQPPQAAAVRSLPVLASASTPELGPEVHPPRRAPMRYTPLRAVGAAPEKALSAAPPAVAPVHPRTVVALPSPAPQTSAIPLPWPVGLAMLWVLGAMVFLTKILAGRIGVWRMARTAIPVSRHGWLALNRRLCKQLGISRPVLLVESEDVALPMTWGFREPVVLLPTSAETWSTERLELVLLHELAHVRRLDALTQLVAQLACAFYWFHPLAWLAERRMRALREYACDDQVLAAGNRPSEYAGQILDIVRSMGRRDPHASATLAMARKSSQLEGRLMAILDPQLPRRALGRFGTGAVSLGFLALVLPLAAFQPAAVAQTASDRGPLPRLSQEESERRRQAQAPEAPPAPVPSASVAPTPVPPTGEAPSASAAPTPESAPSIAGAVCRPKGSSTINLTVKDGVRVFNARREDGRCLLEVQSEGEVSRGHSGAPVELSRGGVFVATERNGEHVRKYEARASSSGRLTQRWTLDGQERSVNSETLAFVDEMLSQVGPEGAIRSVARAPQPPAAPTAAASPAPPPAPPAPTAAASPAPPAAPAAPEPYLAPAPPAPPEPPASEGWSFRWSDQAPEEYRERLEQAKAEERAARDALARLERSVGSDSRLAEGLEEVADEYRLAGENTRQAYLDLADKLRSDDLRQDVLKKLMGAAPISLETGRRILQVAAGIRSDEALGEVLDYTHRVKEHELVHGPLAGEYLQAASKLRSDEALADALTNLLHPHAPREAALDALTLAKRISSDEERHRVLVEIKDHQPLDNEMVEAYRAVAGELRSDEVRSEALEELEQARRSGGRRLMMFGNVGGPEDPRVAELKRRSAEDPRAREIVRQLQQEGQKAERWAQRVERDAQRAAAMAEREAERAAALAERQAERAERFAEREAERAARDAERAGRDAERLAQVQSRQFAQSEMERFRQESRRMEEETRRFKQEARRMASELRAKAQELKQKLSRDLEDSNLEAQLDAEIERLENILEE